jgi:hypothetical protein
MATIALGVSARTWFASLPVAGKPSFTAAQGQSARTKLEAELVTIRPHGFEPKEITRPKGRFILAVDNRSGLEEVNLRLDQVAGNRLHQVRVPREHLDWSEVFDLHPGNYVLTEANHPNWVCRITITAQ